MTEQATSQRNGAHPAVIAAIALAALLGFTLLQRRPTNNRLVGQPAPDFALEIVGERTSLGDRIHLQELRGKTVVLDFWATWCQPCQVVAPILQRISQKHLHDDVVIVGVNTSDEPGLAPVFAKSKGLSYPIVYDTGSEVARRYGVENLPTMVVINAKGEIAAVRTGAEGESAIEDLIAEAR